MKMRGDDCLRRAGKRNLGGIAWSGRRGARGFVTRQRVDFEGKREMDGR